jgi:prepilin signal peptidase PulO-like enzyme (type II secretory pathway)
MSEPWFSETPRWLAFLSLLAVLAWPAEQGRFKTAILTVWIAAIVVAGLLIVAAVTALVVQQPFYVVRSLTLLGLVFGVAFGVSFPALRNAYREAELRKTIAADL